MRNPTEDIKIQYKIRKWCWDAEDGGYNPEIEVITDRKTAEERFATIELTDDLPQIELVREEVMGDYLIEEEVLALRG